MVKKLLRLHLWKIFNFFSKNLTPKKDCNFIETKLKTLMFHKKTISSNYNQNTNQKTDENWKKITKIGLAYVEFYI